MLNYLWGAMLILGIVWGVLLGRPAELTDGILTGAKDAVSLCITMAGVMAFWTGMMEVAKEAGIIEKITRLLKPFVGFMFPDIPPGHKARDEISTNIVANVMGLGWAATPAGLKAMESLEELEEERRNGAAVRSDGGNERGRTVGTGERLRGRRKAVPRGTASTEMCTFLILNISSLQLIPINMIAYRAQYGAVNPTAIVAPAILATLVSTAAGVAFAKIAGGRKK